MSARGAGDVAGKPAKIASEKVVKDYAWGEEMAGNLWSFYQGFDPKIEGKVVLDFGCSWGYLVKYLHEHFKPKRIIGVDIEPHWEKLEGHWDWRALGGQVEFRSGQLATEIDIPDESVDFVLCTSVLQYIRPEMLEATLARLYRVLRPGGELLVRTRAFGSHVGADLHRIIDIPFVHLMHPVWHLWRFLERETGEQPRYLNSLTASTYLAMFARAGFQVVTARRRGGGTKSPEIREEVKKAYPWIAPDELLCAELECRLRRPATPGEPVAEAVAAPQAARKVSKTTAAPKGKARPTPTLAVAAKGTADSQKKPLVAQASTILDSSFTRSGGSADRLVVEALSLPHRQCVFLEHALPRDGSGPGTVVIAQSKRAVLYLSDDLGETWRPLSLEAATTRSLRRHFLTAEGFRIVQTDLPAETFVVDQAGRFVAKPSLGDFNWHGTWAIDQSASGVIMFGQYRASRERLGGEILVFRSVDGGRNWSTALALPGRKDGVEGEIRHIHVCQADPHLPGRWYVTSGDWSNECGIWITDDDGVTWRRLYPAMADGRDIRADKLPKLLRLTAWSIEPDALVWITDDNINGGRTALCRLEKDGWKLHELAACSENLMRSFVRMTDGRYVAISEVKADPSSASVYLVDRSCRPAGEITIPNATGKETGFTYAMASRKAWNNTFFSKSDQRMLGPAAGGVLRWRLGEGAAARATPAETAASDTPAQGKASPAWFPSGFEPREDDLLVFFHSQRTGGMSLRRLIQRVYGVESVMAFRKSPTYAHWAKLDEAALQNYKVWAGHAAFAEKSLKRRCLYISTIRNPRSRLVSVYRYIRGRAGHKFHDMAVALNIEGFYREVVKVDPRYASNRQTYFVCGRPDAAYAIDHVSSRFLGVGVLDHVDRFAAELGRVLRWEVSDIGSENAASTPLNFEIPESFIEYDREINAEDWKLYEFVKQYWAARG